MDENVCERGAAANAKYRIRVQHGFPFRTEVVHDLDLDTAMCAMETGACWMITGTDIIKMDLVRPGAVIMSMRRPLRCGSSNPGPLRGP